MAASSKSPPCSHEDINSIFLNSETVLFLHQIFLKGLTARMDSWPTLVLGTSLGALLFHFLSITQDAVLKGLRDYMDTRGQLDNSSFTNTFILFKGGRGGLNISLLGF